MKFVFLLYLSWLPAGSLLAASQPNPIELLFLDFICSLKEASSCTGIVCYHNMCPYLKSTCPFLHGKGYVLFFFLKKLNKEVIKMQHNTWHSICIFPAQCFGVVKVSQTKYTEPSPTKTSQCIGDSCWESFGQQAAAEQ